MTIISRKIVTPIVGKAEIVLERCKRLTAIINRAGGAARVTKVVLGEGAGDFEIYARFPSFSAGTKAMQAMAADPEFKAFEEERTKAPAATAVGPHVHRIVTGELTAQPVILQRIYRLPRTQLQNMIALMPELRTLFDSSVGIARGHSGFGPEMDSFGVIYYVDTLDALGHALDTIGTSEGFQNLVQKAAQYATLSYARVLTAV